MRSVLKALGLAILVAIAGPGLAHVDAYRLAHVRIQAARLPTHVIVDRVLDAIAELPQLYGGPADAR